MSITKRITKFLLIAALAIPAWNAASAQKPTAPPEKATAEAAPVTKPDKSRVIVTKLAGNRAIKQLDLCNGGSTTQERVPIYGYWLDAANHGQMIYPADSLTDLVGAKITSITFHASSAISSTSGSTDAPVTLKIGATNQTNFSSNSFINVSSFTSSCTLSTIFNNAKEVTFNFTTPLTYNGGNLLLDMSCEDVGSRYGHVYWISKSVSGASLQQYSDYDATVQNYLPYITINYQVTPTEPYLASLSGNGTFGEIYKGTTKSATITVLNEGTTAFTPKLASSEPAFTITGDMDSQLASDQSRNFTVTFTPSKAQEYSGTLTLSATESNLISASIPLSGKGVSDVIVADGDPSENGQYVPVWGYWFDNLGMHDQMIYPASMLSNIDGKKIKSITFYAPTTGILFGNPDGSKGTGDLDVTLGTTTNEYFSSTAIQTLSGTTVTKTITPEYGATKMTITFDEPFEYNSSNGTKHLIVDTKVSEVGTYSSSTRFAGIATDNSQSLYSHTTSDMVLLAFLPKISFELEIVSVDKTELDFGNVEVNTTSAAQTVTVSNSGEEAVDLSWTFSNGKFATTATTPTTVPAGGQVEIPVTFAPTAVGSQSGTLVITTDDKTFNVTLSGKGLKAYAATVNPQTVDFGAVAKYSSETATVTLTNTGVNAITPTITQPAAPFSVTGDEGALASGETRTYTITFAPTAEESYNGSFTIADADHSVSCTVTLAGQGAPMNPLTTNSPVDFGSVAAPGSTTRTATFTNPNNVPLTVTLTTAAPFSISESASPLTIPANGSANVTVTFTANDAASHTGSLTATVEGVNTVVVLKGVGTMSGPEAIRDKDFFAGITYKWPITTEANTSTLDSVATDPDQMIALIREVYRNPEIPGSFKRGYVNDTYGDVYYGGVDKVSHTGSSYAGASNYGCNNSYGWNLPASIVYESEDWTVGSSTVTSHFAYMNPEQYKPNNEGVTLLLVEMTDDFTPSSLDNTITDPYQRLKAYVQKSFKSVRVVTQAKRTGEGEARGTLFNIDCDKMNKFFLMSKGQMRFTHNSYIGESSVSYNGSDGYTHYYYLLDDFCPYPAYIYSNIYYNSGYKYSSTATSKFVDEFTREPFYHMFEQYSPVSNESDTTKADIYRDLVKMASFGVIHDCMDVSIKNHQFEMYGRESGAADCQDVRDLMFFVPDYRMKYWLDTSIDDGRDNTVSSWADYQKFMNYNPDIQPTMGLYVILQDTVEAVTRADDYFKLKLTWDSNMDEFMPGDQQEYQLYQVVTDEFGVSSWKPVYYTKVVNNQVVYTDKNGNVVDTPVPIVLTMNPSSSKKTYAEVYVPRADATTEVTYAIRGQDVDHFLSLQMSNEQSYVIPGKDPAEMVMMSSATVYSRYEAQNENNCYSNKIQMKAAPKTIKASYLPNGSTMTLNRSYSKVGENGTVTVTEPIATLTVTNSGSSKYFTVSGSVLDNVESLFPKGTHDNKTAGYHANNFTNNRINFSTQTIGDTEYINFDLAIWDNFVANVSKNEHPGLYSYQLRFNTAVSFPGLNGQTNEAYSNPIRVFVYKTDSKMNEPLTLAQVKGDTGCSDDYTPGDVEFSAQVMLSGKGEILRYDAYRWKEGAPRSIIYDGGLTDEDEEDVDPNGMAGNQGDSYTVTMNEVGTANYYVGDAVPVTETAPQNWAKFVDYYPATLENGGAFTYAPVVELFTKGYVAGSTTEERGDYNTYGGPLKTTAVGKMELEIPDNLNTAGNPFMSSYKWFDGQNWCAYYKIPVKFHALGIPEGYELYKIRAWRDVDTNILREELSSRQGRIAANYLFEDLTYGDALGDGHTMSKANLFQNHEGTINSYELGRRPVENTDPDSNIQGETHATFGALRINTDDDQPYAIEDFSATIKVRAYFTKSSNPILSDPIYVICDTGVKDENNNSWGFSNPVGTLICEDGANFTGTVTIPEGADGSHKGYFMFSKQLGSSWTNNPQYIFGPEASGNEVLGEWPNNAGYNLKYWQGGTKVFEVYPGTYQLSIGSHVQDLATSAQYGYQAGYITITRVANSKAPTRDLVPADYGYYVADGEVEFNSNMFNQIITGVTDVTMNATREVMSVSYVNTIGQVSSTPWKGVNMVVTRYTDGSTSTTKVMK